MATVLAFRTKGSETLTEANETQETKVARIQAKLVELFCLTVESIFEGERDVG